MVEKMRKDTRAITRFLFGFVSIILLSWLILFGSAWLLFEFFSYMYRSFVT